LKNLRLCKFLVHFFHDEEKRKIYCNKNWDLVNPLEGDLWNKSPMIKREKEGMKRENAENGKRSKTDYLKLMNQPQKRKEGMFGTRQAPNQSIYFRLVPESIS
jgi:hypothetical protein